MIQVDISGTGSEGVSSLAEKCNGCSNIAIAMCDDQHKPQYYCVPCSVIHMKKHNNDPSKSVCRACDRLVIVTSISTGIKPVARFKCTNCTEPEKERDIGALYPHWRVITTPFIKCSKCVYDASIMCHHYSHSPIYLCNRCILEHEEEHEHPANIILCSKCPKRAIVTGRGSNDSYLCVDCALLYQIQTTQATYEERFQTLGQRMYEEQHLAESPARVCHDCGHHMLRRLSMLFETPNMINYSCSSCDEIHREKIPPPNWIEELFPTMSVSNGRSVGFKCAGCNNSCSNGYNRNFTCTAHLEYRSMLNSNNDYCVHCARRHSEQHKEGKFLDSQIRPYPLNQRCSICNAGTAEYICSCPSGDTHLCKNCIRKH